MAIEIGRALFQTKILLKKTSRKLQIIFLPVRRLLHLGTLCSGHFRVERLYIALRTADGGTLRNLRGNQGHTGKTHRSLESEN